MNVFTVDCSLGPSRFHPEDPVISSTMTYKVGLYTLALFVSWWDHALPQSPPLPTPPTYSRALETALRTELFDGSNYSTLQRPDQKVDVRLSLTLLTVNELDIKDQVLSISGYLSVNWRDDRLSWKDTTSTSQDYSSINFLFSTEEHVWTPAIIVENSVEDISVISDSKIPMRITWDGMIHWNPTGIYKVVCVSDITYYPLDTQTCFIKISTWGYTQGEIQLHLDNQKSFDTSFYNENGEWDLYSATGIKSSDRSRGGESYSSLTFTLTLRRKPEFHIINTIFPMILMAFLIPMVYKLPPESGEKMGYCLTVLLAYAVYLSLISDNIPSTSKNICYLSVYLCLILAYSTISVTIVSCILNAYAQGERKVTGCINSICCCFKSKRVADKNHVTYYGDQRRMRIEEFPPDYDSEMNVISYREYSKILDKIFFVVYIVIITITTAVFLILLLIHFYSIEEKSS